MVLLLDLDLSVQFLFAFGDFVAVRFVEPEIQWKFDLRRDLGICLGDALGTKRGSLILNPTTGAVSVRLDCIKLELTDEMNIAQILQCKAFFFGCEAHSAEGAGRNCC